MRVEDDSYRCCTLCCTLSNQSEGEERISTSALASPHRDLQSATTVAFHNILPSVDNTPRFYPKAFEGAKFKFIFFHLISFTLVTPLFPAPEIDSYSFRHGPLPGIDLDGVLLSFSATGTDPRWNRTQCGNRMHGFHSHMTHRKQQDESKMVAPHRGTRGSGSATPLV